MPLTQAPTAALLPSASQLSAITPTIFCFAVFAVEFGERDNIVHMLDHDLFGRGCDAFRLYSNRSRLAGVSDHPNCAPHDCLEPAINGSMAGMKPTWTSGTEQLLSEMATRNTHVFKQAWLHILVTRMHLECEWTLKIEPDVVWMPERLRALLSLYDSSVATLGGNAMPNCSSMIGPMEVLSRPALVMMDARRQLGWGDGHLVDSRIGEDWWLWRLMRLLGVPQTPMPLMLRDDPDRPGGPVCEGCEVGFTPLKSSADWAACYARLVAKAAEVGPLQHCPPRSDFSGDFSGGLPRALAFDLCNTMPRAWSYQLVAVKTPPCNETWC